jgi:hypothetical protein
MTEAETADSTNPETALCEAADMLKEMREILDCGGPVPRRVFIGALEAVEARVMAAVDWVDAREGVKGGAA